MDPATLLGPIDALAPYIEAILVVLVVANMGTRILAFWSHQHQARDGPEAISRYLPHELSNVVLVLASFYYMTVHPHGGMVLSAIVLTAFVADFFEFEARKVEAREERPLDRPKSAIAASLLALAYAVFQAAFWIVAPYWGQVV